MVEVTLFGFILKVEPIEFANTLDSGHKIEEPMIIPRVLK